jgi:WD40 repeat protein
MPQAVNLVEYLLDLEGRQQLGRLHRLDALGQRLEVCDHADLSSTSALRVTRSTPSTVVNTEPSRLGDRTLRLWDLETGAHLCRFDTRTGLVTSVAVLGDGRRVLSESRDHTLQLWDLETGAELARLTFDAATNALAWSPERRRAVVGDANGRIHVVDRIE